ncbi:MAG TPA: lysophospholipid acyltransferase family protein [Actinomycetes bacterium]
MTSPAAAARNYRAAGVVIRPLMRAWFRLRVEGAEHVPAGGPAILAANHRSNVDPVLLGAALRRPVSYMAKEELFVWPLGTALRLIGQFPVRRGGADREALRQTEEVLARGGVLGLFPEGTRGAGRFATVHAGLAYIVLRQQCPVLPVAMLGTERVRRRWGWLPFAAPVRVVVGPPLDLPDPGTGRAGRRAAAEALRRALEQFVRQAEAAPGQLSDQSIN